MVLVGLTQALNFLYEFLILIALHGNGKREATHDESRRDIVVLCYSLQVGHFESVCRLSKDIGEILCHESIDPLHVIETQDPVVRWLLRSTGGLVKVFCISKASQ